MTTPLFLGQNVHLGSEVRVRLNRTGRSEHLTTLDVLALSSAQQHPNVITRLALFKQLAEHLNTGTGGLDRIADTHNLDLVAHLEPTALDTTRHHRPATGNGEHKTGGAACREIVDARERARATAQMTSG